MKSLEIFTVPLLSFIRLISRLKHPVSLPEEVAFDLGIVLSNRLNYQQLTDLFRQEKLIPSKLHRFMSRQLAEQSFVHAVKIERFCRESHFSYCFDGNWIDFTLHFDQNDQLRRLYVHCCGMAIDEQQEIDLMVKTPIAAYSHPL